MIQRVGEDELIIASHHYDEEAEGESDDNEDFFEVVDDGKEQDEQTNLVDAVVGKLEEVLLHSEFEQIRLQFCRLNCDIFEDSEENKLEYTELFDKFSSLVENTLEEKLKVEFPQFTVAWFLELLVQQQKEDPCEGDVFDILFNLGDFEEFKDMMVAFKKEKEETPAESTDTANSVTFEVKRMRIFSEEQEDGDVRPDLDLSSLQILPLGQSS